MRRRPPFYRPLRTIACSCLTRRAESGAASGIKASAPSPPPGIMRKSPAILSIDFLADSSPVWYDKFGELELNGEYDGKRYFAVSERPRLPRWSLIFFRPGSICSWSPLKLRRFRT